MNSMSSVLSYNQFDFGPIFKHGEQVKDERREKHEPSFVKQMIYFILFMILNLGLVLNYVTFKKIQSSKCPNHRLTISTEITMMSMDSVLMVDTNGIIHSLSKLQVRLKKTHSTLLIHYHLG